MARKKVEQEKPVTFLPGETLSELFARQMSATLRGEDKKVDPHTAEVDVLRDICRKGNPFPLIARQWPQLLLTDPEEIEIFQRSLTEKRFEHMTEGIREACFNPNNPPLRLDWWQKIVLAAYFDVTVSELYVKGCTGAGKGASTSMAINLWFDVFNESRTTLTSETFAHAKMNIYGEVAMWRHKMAFPGPGVTLSESIADHERHYIIVRNPGQGDGESFSGAHGANTLYVFDEATATPDVLIENAEKNARMICCLANPRTLSGRFRNAFEPLGSDRIDSNAIVYGNIGMRLCITVDGADCINVVEKRLKVPVAPRGGMQVNGTNYVEGQRISDEHYPKVNVLIPNQIDTSLFLNNCARPDSREVDIYAHGKFPKEDEERQVILASWLPEHEEYWKSLMAEGGPGIKVECFGLDVARSLRGDETSLAAGGRQGLRELHKWRINDIVAIADEVVKAARVHYDIDLTLGRAPITVDYGGGYGSGVGDILKRMGVYVIEFQPSGSTSFPKNYTNLRTESYAMLGRQLDPSMTGVKWALIPRQDLRVELTAPEKAYGTDGIRFGLESKDEIKKKLNGRSPDVADSTVYLFHSVRILHDLDRWLMNTERRLLVYPESAKEAEVMSHNAKVASKTAKELEGIKFEWSVSKLIDSVKVNPDENKAPWYSRYLGGN